MMLIISNGSEQLTICSGCDALAADLQNTLIELLGNYGGELASHEDALLTFTCISWGVDFEKALNKLLDGYGFTLNCKGHEELTYFNRP